MVYRTKFMTFTKLGHLLAAFLPPALQTLICAWICEPPIADLTMYLFGQVQDLVQQGLSGYTCSKSDGICADKVLKRACTRS